MDAGIFDKYVEERYWDQIKWYERRAQQNQRWHRALLPGSSVKAVIMKSSWPSPARDVTSAPHATRKGC